jgi:hypothetical protein
MHALKAGRMQTLKAVTVTRASCHPLPYRDDAIGREEERRRGGEEGGGADSERRRAREESE